MGNPIPNGRKKNALMGAIGAGIFAGAATMFIPTSVLGAITGATGLSELVPATAAPLGDKARALIAFGAGALTLAIGAILLLRKEDAIGTDTVSVSPQAPKAIDKAIDNISLADRLAGVKERLPQIKLPKMPWVKGDNEVRDLSDLPSIRRGDAHPDAPARRPLLATRDLPLNTGAPHEINTPPSSAIAANDAAPFQVEQAEFAPVLQVADAPAPNLAGPVPSAVAMKLTEKPIEPEVPILEPTGNIGSDDEKLTYKPAAHTPAASELSAMLDQFEAAIDRRRSQLGALTSLVAQASATERPPVTVNSQERHHDVAVPVEPSYAEPVETPAPVRPPLEAVPDLAGGDGQEVDVALNPALATLHRMNAQAR